MTENELDKSDYYLRKLELHQRFGKVFGKIPLPNGVPFYFQLFLFFVVFFIEVNIGSYFILPILANLYIMDVYYIVQTRKLVIDRCLIQEDILENYKTDYRVHIVRIKTKIDSTVLQKACETKKIIFKLHTSEERLTKEEEKELKKISILHAFLNQELEVLVLLQLKLK
jgi:hypothetical protein